MSRPAALITWNTCISPHSALSKVWSPWFSVWPQMVFSCTPSLSAPCKCYHRTIANGVSADGNVITSSMTCNSIIFQVTSPKFLTQSTRLCASFAPITVQQLKSSVNELWSTWRHCSFHTTLCIYMFYIWSGHLSTSAVLQGCIQLVWRCKLPLNVVDSDIHHYMNF